MSAGWYRMHRGWMESKDFKPEPFTEREAFIWSIEHAAFEPHSQWFNGRLVDLDRGQLVTSLREMCAEFNWTIKRVRGFIERMTKCRKWAHETAHTHCIITICNYDEYQSADADEGHSRGQAEGTPRAHPGHSQGTQDKKTQEGEEGKEGEDSAAAESAAAAGEADDLFGDQGGEKPKPQTFPTIEALDLWNTYAGRCGWPTVRKLTEARRDKLRSRLKEIGGLIEWEGALARAEASDLLHPTGLDPPQWFDFDFLIRNETNVIKLLEGRYDHRRNTGNGSHEARPPAGLPGLAGAAARALARRESRDGDEGTVRVPADP